MMLLIRLFLMLNIRGLFFHRTFNFGIMLLRYMFDSGFFFLIFLLMRLLNMFMLGRLFYWLNNLRYRVDFSHIDLRGVLSELLRVAILGRLSPFRGGRSEISTF